MRTDETHKPIEYKRICADLVNDCNFKGVSDFKDYPLYLLFDNCFKTEIKYLTRNDAQKLFHSLSDCLQTLAQKERPENL